MSATKSKTVYQVDKETGILLPYSGSAVVDPVLFQAQTGWDDKILNLEEAGESRLKYQWAGDEESSSVYHVPKFFGDWELMLYAYADRNDAVTGKNEVIETTLINPITNQAIIVHQQVYSNGFAIRLKDRGREVLKGMGVDYKQFEMAIAAHLLRAAEQESTKGRGDYLEWARAYDWDGAPPTRNADPHEERE